MRRREVFEKEMLEIAVAMGGDSLLDLISYRSFTFRCRDDLYITRLSNPLLKITL
jgi:hypothetical protein